MSPPPSKERFEHNEKERIPMFEFEFVGEDSVGRKLSRVGKARTGQSEA